MKKIFVILALMASVNVFAATQNTSIDLSKLTPEQRSQISQQVSELASQPTNVSATVRKEAEAWGELGSNMGKAMVGAAKEVGVAANEFSQTPLGQVVVFMAAYKIVGHDMLGVVFGSLVLLFGWSLALWIFTTKRWSDVKYEYEPVLWGLYKKARIVEIRTDSDTVTGKILSGIGILVVSTLVGLNTIF
jgi:hypothetical protein